MSNVNKNITVEAKLISPPTYFTRRPLDILITARSILLRMRNVSDKNCRENKKNCVKLLSFFENRALYEVMWKQFCRAGQATGENIKRRLRIACLINQATHTLTVCNTVCFSTTKMVPGTHLNFALCLSF